MKHEALRELRDLTNIPDSHLRSELLSHWIDRWIVEAEFVQAVVDTSVLASEHSDLIKLKLAQSLAEDLAEECISYKTGTKRVSAAMWGLRRKAK